MKLLAITLLAAATFLTACGGGGGDGAVIPPVVTPPGGGNNGGAATQLSIYEALPLASNITATEFLNQINGEGARGFRFFSGLAFSAGAGITEQVAAYVKDADTTWTFELQPDTASSADLQTQSQAAGARGFRFAGPYVVANTFYNLYRKDNNSATTYTTSLLPAAVSSSEFLAQANAQGANRFYASGATYQFGASTVQVYEQASSGNATYAYELLDNPATDAALLAQFDSEGARGFRFRTSFVFSDGTKTVYEKDTSQSSTFVFSNQPSQGNSAAYIQQANARGAMGEVLVGDYVLPGGTISTLYVKPASCAGFLCTTRNLFGF